MNNKRFYDTAPARPSTWQLVFDLGLILGTTFYIFYAAFIGLWRLSELFFLIFFEVYLVLTLNGLGQLIVWLRGGRFRWVRGALLGVLSCLALVSMFGAVLYYYFSEAAERAFAWPQWDRGLMVVMGVICLHHIEHLFWGLKSAGKKQPYDTMDLMSWTLFVFLSLFPTVFALQKGMAPHYVPLVMVAVKALGQLIVATRYWIAAGFGKLLGMLFQVVGGADPK